MESLDSKLCRLSPEQQREVEDFVDFLLQRPGTKPAEPARPAAVTFPLAAAPPPLTVQEPAGELKVRIDNVIPGQTPQEHLREQDPATLPIQEIASEKEDIIASGYMDYGKFERAATPPPAPSPATEAVQRVKIKLGGKKVHDPARNLLDWID